MAVIAYYECNALGCHEKWESEYPDAYSIEPEKCPVCGRKDVEEDDWEFKDEDEVIS